MDRRRAAAALLALAACFACSTAAPTASNHTALDVIEGSSEGCYYNFQHYGEGDRIMTNEPCLNCTCHNRMLMCYLRVCPFTKPIGQDCTVEKRADQCCPIVTCPDVPVNLLTSTSTSSPAEYGTSGIGKQDKYGCSMNGKYFPEGSKVPSTPNKPCEHCYCIRNMTTCVMQECTLHVDGCTPIYHKDVCCPVRYSCDHLEDEIPLLDDMTTTVRPTPGFLLTTTTMVPVTQPSQECVHDDQIFPDGAHIKTEKPCEHCYCMKGDIVCVVQGCGTPMENEGKNCTALPLRPGQCCPDTYICDGDELDADISTEVIDLSTMPPRRVSEGSGYRNEPDEPLKDLDTFETDIEGSGDDYSTTVPTVTEMSSINKNPSYLDGQILSTTNNELLVSQSTESTREQNHIPDSDKIISEISDQDLLLYSTEKSSDSEFTSDEITTTASDKDLFTNKIILEQEEILTTESALTNDDTKMVSEVTVSQEEQMKVTKPSVDLAEETMDKKSKPNESVDFTTPLEYNSIATTESVKHFSDTIDTTNENPTISVIYETQTNKQPDDKTASESISDKDMPATATTLMLQSEDVSTISPIYNEIDENREDVIKPARIPGEGDCLLNGKTYSNNTNVPRSNNCHTSCKCVSSIIKCDPIICSPPPEYMENMNDCQPIYDSSDSCCPTYVCSAKETIPPQSHSQMSGTESPKPSDTSECDGTNCSLDEGHLLDSSKPCTSENCINEPTNQEETVCKTKECSESAQKLPATPEDCSDNKCQVLPTGTCEGENCYNYTSEQPVTVDVDTEKELNVKDPNICGNNEGCQETIETQQVKCDSENCINEPKHQEETLCKTKECSESAQKLPATPEDCSDSKCKVLPTGTCEGENCYNYTSEQPVIVDADTEKEFNLKEPNICSNKEGCLETIDTQQVECENQICRRKEESKKDDTFPSVTLECTGKECEVVSYVDIIQTSTENQPMESTEKQISDKGMVTNLASEPTSQSYSNQKDIIDISVTTESEVQTESNTLFDTDEDLFPKLTVNPKETTEKNDIHESVTDNETKAFETEPSYEESSRPVQTTLEDFTEKDNLVTDKSIKASDNEIEKNKPYEESTLSSQIEDDEKITNAPEFTELDMSTNLELSTVNNKMSVVTVTPQIEDIDLIGKEFSESTKSPIQDLDRNGQQNESLQTTSELPEVNKDTLDDVKPIEVVKDTIHTPSETSTNENIQESIVTIPQTTEFTDLQDTKQPELVTPNETTPDKINTPLYTTTEHLEVNINTDSSSINMVDDVTEYKIAPTDVSQSPVTPEDDIITKSYETATEDNKVPNKLPEYSTEPSFPGIYDTTNKLEYSTIISVKLEENEQSTTESKITYTERPDNSETETYKIPKSTINPIVDTKETMTQRPEVEKSDESSIAPNIGTTHEAESSEKSDIGIETTDQTILAELTKVSPTSTEANPISLEMQVVTKDTGTKLNALDNTSPIIFSTESIEPTAFKETLATKSSPEYTTTEEMDTQHYTTSKSPKEEVSKLNIYEPGSTLPDNLIKQELTTVSDKYDEKLVDPVTDNPVGKATTAQIEATEKLSPEENEVFTESEHTTEKYLTESQVTVGIENVQAPDTTPESDTHHEEKLQEEIKDESLHERATVSPNIDQTIKEDSESSTSFTGLDTTKELEKSTVNQNIGTDKVPVHGTDTLSSETPVESTDKTHTPIPLEITTEQKSLETTEKAIIEVSPEDINEPPTLTNKLEEPITTEKHVTTESLEIAFTFGHADPTTIGPEKDFKLDHDKQEFSEPDKNTQLQEMLPTLLTPENKLTTLDEAEHFVTSEMRYEDTSETEQNGMSSPTSISPEKIPTVYPDISTIQPPRKALDTEIDVTLDNIDQQTDKLETIRPTKTMIDDSDVSELTTEAIIISSSTFKITEDNLVDSEKKPTTESVSKTSTEVPYDNNVSVFVESEKMTTELINPEMTTLSTNIVYPEKDLELISSSKPQNELIYDTTRDSSSKEVEAVTSTENLKELSVSEETLAYTPEKTVQTAKPMQVSDSVKPELDESERVTTEISVIQDFSVPDSITEETLAPKPTSGFVTDGVKYETVTEQTHNDISPQINTDLPVVTGVDNFTTSPLQEKYVTTGYIDKDPEHTDAEKIVTYSPDSINKDIENEAELVDKTELTSDVPVVTSPVSVDKEKETLPEEKYTLSGSSESNQPTEYIPTEKEVKKTTNGNTEIYTADFDITTAVFIPSQKDKEHKDTSDVESTYSETTPFSVELEEHTHFMVHESSTVPVPEIPTDFSNETLEPERGDTPESDGSTKIPEVGSLDIEIKEKPVTSVEDITEQNIASTITSMADNKIEVHTDLQSPGTEHIPTIEEEGLMLSTSPLPPIIYGSTSYTTVHGELLQPSLSPESAVSIEKDLPSSEKQPVLSAVSDKDTTEEIAHGSTSKLDVEIHTESSSSKQPDQEETQTSITPSSEKPESLKPVFNEEPIEDVPSPDFAPSGTGGYGQEPDYIEEDQAFGPGTCRYGGKVYVSAQQIPRDDPCDFCFCFRSDIICLQQSCPPPIHGCHEEPIQGFCCPRYECPVSMATTLNMTTTTTTTTTTLPPHFLPHAYKGAAQRKGCQIKGHSYKVGEVVRASSGPCLHCTCGGDGQMKCDPKACTPEPMLRQMIAAAVSAKRRR